MFLTGGVEFCKSLTPYNSFDTLVLAEACYGPLLLHIYFYCSCGKIFATLYEWRSHYAENKNHFLKPRKKKRNGKNKLQALSIQEAEGHLPLVWKTLPTVDWP
jgi:hypothetical protein